MRLDLKGGCKLQVYGVNSLDILKKLHATGVERVVTTKTEAMHTEWMKEVEKINFPELMQTAPTVPTAPIVVTVPTEKERAKKTETENLAARMLRLLPQEEPKMLTDGKKAESGN